ncbi:MAG: hypothetical protein ACI33S_05550 [Bacilli bacterium]|nr:hypothetical protein [bacterium]
MQSRKELKVIILDSGIEIEEVENVKIIRIKSDNYSLLILKDYWPVVGEINGSISIEGERNIRYDNINGFYSLSRNLFYLIIKDKGE